MPFIPANEQLQHLFNQMTQQAGGMFSAPFDNAYEKQLQEQKNAREVFETIARSHPELASFLSQQPGVMESLTKSPRTFPKPGEGAGAKLEAATKTFTPAGVPAGKPTTIASAGAYVNKIAQGYQTAFKKPLPAGVVSRMTEIVASGRFPDDTELTAMGLTEDDLSAAASASGDAEIPLTTEVYRGLVQAQERESGAPLSDEQKADIFLRLTSGKSQDVRDQMTALTIERLNQAIASSDLQTEYMTMRNEIMRDKPMSVDELRKAHEAHDIATANANILTKAANSLSSISPSNPKAMIALSGLLRQIQGNDPASQSIRDAVLSVATLIITTDPASRQQQLGALREMFLRARDHFNQIESLEAEAIKGQTKKPSPAGGASSPEETDEVDDLINELENDEQP